MVKTSEERIGIVETEVDNLKISDSSQWSAIEKLKEKFDLLMRKWIPAWVAFVLMAMSAVTASALTFAGMIIRMSK